MFGSLARWLQLRAAARRYARALGPQLMRDFGPGPFYTRAQIGKAAARAALPRRHIAFGYAAFMDEASFNALPEAATSPGYAALRAMLRKHAKHAPSAGFEPMPESVGVVAGADTWPGSDA